MKVFTCALVTVVLVASLAACQGEYLLGVVKGLSTERTVCASGFSWGPSGNTACYYTLRTQTDKKEMTRFSAGPDQDESCARAIACSGDTVYTAGYYATSTFQPVYSRTRVACYWTNDVRHDLPGGLAPNGARALSIFVSGQTIHVAGQYHDGTKYRACYWANGVKFDLTGGRGDACANSIFVSGAVVYAAGYCNDGTRDVPCYWRGGARTDLPAGSGGGEASAICLSGGSLYVAGHYSDGVRERACCWKGGARTDLPDGSGDAAAYGICTMAGSEYVVGYYNNGTRDIACCWKDGVKTDLPAGGVDARAYSMCIVGGTRYVAGYRDTGWAGEGSACCWTDERGPMDLEGGGCALYSICEGPPTVSEI